MLLVFSSPATFLAQVCTADEFSHAAGKKADRHDSPSLMQKLISLFLVSLSCSCI